MTHVSLVKPTRKTRQECVDEMGVRVQDFYGADAGHQEWVLHDYGRDTEGETRPAVAFNYSSHWYEHLHPGLLWLRRRRQLLRDKRERPNAGEELCRCFRSSCRYRGPRMTLSEFLAE